MNAKKVFEPGWRLLGLLAVGWISISCGGHDHPPAEKSLPPPVSVQTESVTAETIPVFEEVVGTVRPRKEARVSAKVTGRILELHAIPGKRAKAGEILAKVEIGELEASLERAKASLDQANRDLDRYRKLQGTGGVAEAEVERVESQQRVAVATVKEIQVMVENATVKAPFDGTITRKLAEPGDLAIPGRPLFAMEDSSLLRFEINVGESIAGDLDLGDTFRVQIAGAGADFDGTVSELSPSADVASRTFLIKLDLPDQETLRAGQFGRAFLPRGSRKALRVPAASLISRGQMDYVFVARDQIARLRIVRTGRSEEGRVEVLSGLDDGEVIVSAPPAGLRDGQPLKNG